MALLQLPAPRGWYRNAESGRWWMWWDGSQWTRLRTRFPNAMSLYLAVVSSVVLLWTFAMAVEALGMTGWGPQPLDPGEQSDVDWVAGQNGQLETLVWIASVMLVAVTVGLLVFSRPVALHVMAVSLAAETWIVASAGWIIERSASFHHVEGVFAGSLHAWAVLRWALAAATVVFVIAASRQRDPWPVDSEID